ncbi:macrophage mannose receptor 1-like isoform X2 [Vanessa tameamea]|uniref:Macrophage mannose receptor 1-like isoform X2 n=1 Tax=Vanessa tameamea TaxID=334116 RepID=A0ABM4AKY2_VANTA
MILQNYLFTLLILFACSVAGKHFRFDYDYNEYVDGWFKLHLIPATWHDAWLRCDLEGESLARMPVKWAPGEPDNFNNREDCIVLTNGTIADVNCSEIFPYICFKKNTKDIIMTTCGTVDKEYKLESLTGNCYKFHQIGKPWKRAFMTCAAEGSYLAVINSPQEALLLKNIYDANHSKIRPGTSKDVINIGMHDWNEHGVWRTIHGLTIEEAGYADWAQGQPDNSSGQFCGAMFRNSKLDDFWCHASAPFICEKSLDSLLEL